MDLVCPILRFQRSVGCGQGCVVVSKAKLLFGCKLAQPCVDLLHPFASRAIQRRDRAQHHANSVGPRDIDHGTDVALIERGAGRSGHAVNIVRADQDMHHLRPQRDDVGLEPPQHLRRTLRIDAAIGPLIAKQVRLGLLPVVGHRIADEDDAALFAGGYPGAVVGIMGADAQPIVAIRRIAAKRPQDEPGPLQPALVVIGKAWLIGHARAFRPQRGNGNAQAADQSESKNQGNAEGSDRTVPRPRHGSADDPHRLAGAFEHADDLLDLFG